MNGQLILEGVIEIVIALVTGFLVFFGSLKVFMLLTRKIDETAELKKKNEAVAVVLAAFVLSLILIVNSAVSPAMETLRNLITAEAPGAVGVLLAILRIIVTYVVSGVVAIIVLWLAIALYTGLTSKINEMEELKKNNLAIGIVFGTFIFSAGLIVLEPLKTILDAFVGVSGPANVEVQATFLNPTVLLQGLIELPIAFIGTILVFLLSVKLSDWMTGKIREVEELKKNNVAVAIYTASITFSIMYLVKSALTPAYNVLGASLGLADQDLAGEATAAVSPLLAIGLILGIFVGTAIIAFLLLRLALFVFMLLTRKIDEMGELKKNNTAIALILAVLTISIMVLVANGFATLLNGITEIRQVASGIPKNFRIK